MVCRISCNCARAMFGTSASRMPIDASSRIMIAFLRTRMWC
jgi:hypothetical protein